MKELAEKVESMGKQSRPTEVVEVYHRDARSSALIEEYKAKIATLEHRLLEESKSRHKFEELETHITSARTIISELGKEKEDAVNKAKLMEAKAKDLMEKLVVASKQNEELRKNGQFLYSSLKEDKGHYYYTVQTLENLLTDSHEVLKTLQAENQALKATKQNKENQIQGLMKEKQLLYKELEEAGKTVDELKTVLQLALETFNRSKDTSEVKTEPLSKKIEDLHGQVYNLRSRNNDLENELKSSRRELRTYFSIDAADEQNGVHKQFSTLQYEYTSLEKENLELLQTIEHMQTELHELRTSAPSKDHAIHTLHAEVESLKQLEQDLSSKLEAKDQQLLELHERIESTEQKNSLVERDLQVNCLVMQEILNKRREVKSTLSEYQIEQPIQEYQREIDLLTKKLEDTKSLMNSLLEQDEESRKFMLKHEIDAMLNKEMVQLELSQLQQDKERLSKENAEFLEENISLKQISQENSITIEELNRANINFQNEVTNLAKELQHKSQLLETTTSELSETQQSNQDKLKIIDKQSTDLSEVKAELELIKEKLEQQILMAEEAVYSSQIFKEAQEQVKQLEKERLDHIEQLAYKQTELDQIFEVKAHMIEELKEKDIELGTLRSEKAALKGVLQQQSKDREKVSADLNALQSKLSELEAQRDKLQQDLTSQTNQVEHLKADQSKKDNEISALRIQTEKNAKELANMQAQANVKDEEIMALTTQITALQAQLQSRDKETSDLQVELDAKDNEIANLLSQILEHQTEIEGHRDQISEFTQTISDLNDQISSHQGELESVKAEHSLQLSKLQAAVEQKKPEEELLKQSKYNLELIAELKSQLGLTIDQVDELEKENTQLKEEALAAVVTLDKLKEALVAEKRNSEKALQSQATKCIDLQHLVDVSTKALHEKSLEAELTRKLLEETEKKLEVARAEATDTLSAEVARLTQTKKELELENSEYKEIVDKLEDSVKQLQNKGTQVSHMKEEAEKYRKKIETLERTILDLKDKIQEMKSENDDLKLDMEDQTAEKVKLTKERDLATEKLKKSQQIIVDLEGQLDTTEQELDELSEKYSKLSKENQREITEHQESIDKLKRTAEKERLESENKIAQLTKELHLLQMEGNAIKSKYTALQSAASVEITPMQDLGSLLSNTKDQLIEQLQTELEEFATRYERAVEDKEELKNLLETMRGRYIIHEEALQAAEEKLALCECKDNEPNKFLLLSKNLELLEKMLSENELDLGLKMALQEATSALEGYKDVN